MGFPEGEIPKYEPRRYWQPEKVFEFYRDHDTPLSGSTIEYHLTQLIGTSFFGSVVEEMMDLSDLGRTHPAIRENLFHPKIFFDALNGPISHVIWAGPTPEQRVGAILALEAVLDRDFSPTDVYGSHSLLADEMRLVLARTDNIYTDASRREVAYEHIARQVLFFADGELRDAFATSTVAFTTTDGEEAYTIATMIQDLEYFINPDIKPLRFAPAKAQYFNPDVQISYSALYIGTSFDLGLAALAES